MATCWLVSKMSFFASWQWRFLHDWLAWNNFQERCCCQEHCQGWLGDNNDGHGVCGELIYISSSSALHAYSSRPLSRRQLQQWLRLEYYIVLGRVPVPIYAHSSISAWILQYWMYRVITLDTRSVMGYRVIIFVEICSYRPRDYSHDQQQPLPIYNSPTASRDKIQF